MTLEEKIKTKSLLVEFFDDIITENPKNEQWLLKFQGELAGVGEKAIQTSGDLLERRELYAVLRDAGHNRAFWSELSYTIQKLNHLKLCMQDAFKC